MATAYQNLTYAPTITQYKAENIEQSGSYVDDIVEVNTEAQLFQQNTGNRYNPRRGAFFCQLANYEGDGVGAEFADDISPYEFFEGQVFGIPPLDNIHSGLEAYFGQYASGTNVAHKQVVQIPSTIILQGVVYINDAEFSPIGPDNAPLNNIPTFPGTNPPVTLTNTIPIYYVLGSYNGAIKFTIPSPTPAAAPGGLYGFNIGDNVQVTRIDPSTGALDNNNRFNAEISGYEAFTNIDGVQEVTIYNFNNVVGTFNGTNSWNLQVQTPFGVDVSSNNGLESIVHFEMHHSFTFSNINTIVGNLNGTPTLTTGNNIQGYNDPDDLSSITPSQLTYRKFWTVAGELDPDGVASFSDNFDAPVSLNSPYNNNKAFTIWYNGDQEQWVLQGGFKRQANVMVRGSYQIY